MTVYISIILDGPLYYKRVLIRGDTAAPIAVTVVMSNSYYYSIKRCWSLSRGLDGVWLLVSHTRPGTITSLPYTIYITVHIPIYITIHIEGIQIIGVIEAYRRNLDTISLRECQGVVSPMHLPCTTYRLRKPLTPNKRCV